MNPHDEMEIEQLTHDLQRHYRNGDKRLVKHIAGIIRCLNDRDVAIKKLDAQYLKLYERTHKNAL